MAQPQPAPQQVAQPPATQRSEFGYRGHPENQWNPNARNIHQPQRQGDRPPRAEPPQVTPTHQQAKQSGDKAKNEQIKNSAFTVDFDTREDNPFLEFTPSMSTLMKHSGQLYTAEKLQADFTVVRRMPRGKEGAPVDWTVSVDPDLYRRMMAKGVLYVGYSACALSDRVPVVRCFRIGHFARDCNCNC